MPPGLLEPVAQEVVAPYALEYQLTYPGLGQSAALVQALPVGSVSVARAVVHNRSPDTRGRHRGILAGVGDPTHHSQQSASDRACTPPIPPVQNQPACAQVARQVLAPVARVTEAQTPARHIPLGTGCARLGGT